jgi:nicotinamidase-related amidase
MPNKALLVIDMIKDFVYKDVNPSLAVDNAYKMVMKLRELEESAVKNNIPIIYCCDAHRKGDSELKIWGDHAMEGTKGSEIVDDLITDNMMTIKRNPKLDGLLDDDEKTPNLSHEEIVLGHKIFRVDKGTYNAFFNTALDNLLKTLGVDTVYITGTVTTVCDLNTAAGAAFRGYDVAVVKDCVADVTDEANSFGLDYMRKNYNAGLKSLEEAKNDFEVKK